MSDFCDSLDRARPAYIRLARLARVEVEEGPNSMSRENGKRRIVVSANVRVKDIGSFVEAAQQKIATAVKISVVVQFGNFVPLISRRFLGCWIKLGILV